MNQNERRLFLIRELLREQPPHSHIKLPQSGEEQQRLLRSLMNLRLPQPVSEEFLQIQDEYLTAISREKGITHIDALSPISGELYLWQGDITTLKADGIVNAANSQLLGCFFPCHGCIDNAIHTFSGVQLRLACAEIMKKQGHQEPTGQAKITPAFNLPCRYVLHTVGPIITGKLTKQDCQLLSSCYRSCLELALQNGLNSLAFCCISTGEFHFPRQRAAEIAIETVTTYKNETKSEIKVIFNVFQKEDYDLYRALLLRH